MSTEVNHPQALAAILESIADCFFSLNADWEFTYVNSAAEKFLRLRREALLGKSIWNACPGLSGGEFEKTCRQSAQERSAATLTFCFPDHDAWYEVRAYPFEDGLSVYLRDVDERVCAEEKIRESERRFRLLVDSIPQIVWIIDDRGLGRYFNRQWAIYSGFSVENVSAVEISRNYVHPDDDARTMAAWNEARRTGEVFQVEHRIRSAAGEYRWFLARAEPYRHPRSGEIIRWFGTSTDVHDRKMAEAALKKSNERYRSLLESIDEGFCIIEMIFDQGGHPVDYRFHEVNPTFEQQTGLHQVVGKTVGELAPGYEKHWFEIYAQVAATGVSVRFENEARALDRWFDVFAFRIEEPEGNKVGVLFKDISAQKRVAEALRKSEREALEAARRTEAERQRLDALLQAAPVGIVVSDINGATLLTNATHRQIWGEQLPWAGSVEEFKEWKGWWADHSQKHGRRLTPREWPTARILAGGQALRDIIEIESFDKPAVRHTLLVSGTSIKDSEGRIVGAVIAQMDITDRVKAEEALRQADRRKDEFLAMLAHELRNPLAPIAAAADLLGLGRLDQQQVKQTSGIIARQVRHMTGLVDDLLDVSRVTRGLVTLDKARLDGKRIVADAVEQVRPSIEARRHRLTVHTPPESAFVTGDPNRLVQVMTNLLNNAAKYTPEGGDIVLSIEVTGEYVKMAVTDNGIGMTPELVERAFELFAQAERTSDRSQGGLGIGLALVRSLVELHGGTVTAYSEGIGKGSRFVVCLPHLEQQADAAAAGTGAVAKVMPAESLKVMVVDDNADAAQTLAMLVEALGHQATVEHHPGRALERSRTEKPDVCLLDIGLPDMDGNELARRLRVQPQTAQSMLIAVTGYGQEQDRDAALDAGFDYHFAKPVDTMRLTNLLQQAGKASALAKS